MALKASLVSAQESKAAAFERLAEHWSATFDGDTDVRVVAIGAAHFAFQHRMVVRQLKLRPHFQVTLEASFRRLTRIDDRVRCAAAFNVQSSRPMTRFAADVLRVFSFRHQPGVRCGAKVAYDFLWQVRHSSEPTNSAPGMLGGARIVLFVVLQESRITVSATPPPTAQQSFSRLPLSHRVSLECSTIGAV